MKSFFHENFGGDKSDQSNNIKSSLIPPTNDHLHEFENGMYDMIKNIKFWEPIRVKEN